MALISGLQVLVASKEFLLHYLPTPTRSPYKPVQFSHTIGLPGSMTILAADYRNQRLIGGAANDIFQNMKRYFSSISLYRLTQINRSCSVGGGRGRSIRGKGFEENRVVSASFGQDGRHL